MAETIVLSKEQQIILGTLYWQGIKTICFYDNHLSLYGKGNVFIKDIHFINNSEKFDFSIFGQTCLSLGKMYSLTNIIKEYYPECQEVLRT